MTKWLALPILLLAAGCTAQPRCMTIVELNNSCKIPVQAALENYTNSSSVNSELIIIEPDATILAAQINGFSCDLNESLKKGYSITFDTSLSHKKMERSEIINSVVFNKAKSGRTYRYWLLDTKGLCP